MPRCVPCLDCIQHCCRKHAEIASSVSRRLASARACAWTLYSCVSATQLFRRHCCSYASECWVLRCGEAWGRSALTSTGITRKHACRVCVAGRAPCAHHMRASLVCVRAERLPPPSPCLTRAQYSTRVDSMHSYHRRPAHSAGMNTGCSLSCSTFRSALRALVERSASSLSLVPLPSNPNSLASLPLLRMSSHLPSCALLRLTGVACCWRVSQGW